MSRWLGRDPRGQPSLRRAEFTTPRQFDALRALRQEVRCQLLGEAEKHALEISPAVRVHQPVSGRLLLIALMQNAASFPYQAPLWAYSGFGIEHAQQRRAAVRSRESCSARRSQLRFAG